MAAKKEAIHGTTSHILRFLESTYPTSLMAGATTFTEANHINSFGEREPSTDGVGGVYKARRDV